MRTRLAATSVVVLALTLLFSSVPLAAAPAPAPGYPHPPDAAAAWEAQQLRMAEALRLAIAHRAPGAGKLRSWLTQTGEPAAVTLAAPANHAPLDGTGGIEGFVTAADTHKPLTGMPVAAYDVSSGESVEYDANTDLSGQYLVEVPPGSYKVQFRALSGEPYVGQFYNNAPDYDSATAFSVSANGTTSGIDGTLAAAGRSRARSWTPRTRGSKITSPGSR